MERKQAMNVSFSQGSKDVVEVGSGLRGAIRRKRGRPRKHESCVTSNYPGGRDAMDAVRLPASKGRERRPCSESKQQLSSPGNWLSKGFARMGILTTFMIIVEIVENIAEKILSFVVEGSKALCILSVSGSISSATLRAAGGVLTYEGTKLDILSLSGSLVVDEDNASNTSMDGLNITLSSPEGRVIGGCVDNVLIAATRVQVVVGVLDANLKMNETEKGVKPNSDNKTDPEIAEAKTSNKPSRKKKASTSRGASRGGYQGVRI